MILSAHQPAYLPWLGYFDKIYQSDQFIFLDTVQFEKNSFINRNKIKTPNGPLWLSIPVKIKGHTSSSLLETQIDNSQKWKDKHLKTIWMNYKKAARFEMCYDKLAQLFNSKNDLLTELCYEQLQFWLNEIGNPPIITRASLLPLTQHKSKLILEICTLCGANRYLSGSLGKNYLDIDSFAQNNIEVRFQDYQSPQYSQLHGEFIPSLSILDIWMNQDLKSFFRRQNHANALEENTSRCSPS